MIYMDVKYILWTCSYELDDGVKDYSCSFSEIFGRIYYIIFIICVAERSIASSLANADVDFLEYTSDRSKPKCHHAKD